MEPYRLGFTGTQRGLTPRQEGLLRARLEHIKREHEAIEIHHGDCIGADAAFHRITLEIFGPSCRVVLHPPTVSTKRAFCTSPGQIDLPPLPYLERNHAIVGSVQAMVACPGEAEEQLRSGTWATVRRARKTGVFGWLITP